MHLSNRESEILALLAQGKSDKEIAHSLGLTPSTVQTHVQRIQSKLEAENRVQMGIQALRNGLVAVLLAVAAFALDLPSVVAN